MGMDVYGKNPMSETGKYFRNNVWYWHPLADYVVTTAPDIAQHCTHWNSNEGDGLDAGQSLCLADRLTEELDSGRTAQYEQEYRLQQVQAPDESCWVCEGTGKRQEPPQTGAGDFECNGCQGRGKHPSSSCDYPFSAENVREFSQFLRECGGFEIC